MIIYTVKFYNAQTDEYIGNTTGCLSKIQYLRDLMELKLGIIIQFRIQ